MYWKHREDELIEEINNLGEMNNEDIEVRPYEEKQVWMNAIKATSSGIQFLLIFWIIGFAIYWWSWNIFGWIISGLLLVGLIVYTKKSNKIVKQEIEKKELWYFTIPFWRFFLMQFFTAWLYVFYWMGKNMSFITERHIWWLDFSPNWGYAIYTHLLSKLWKSKVLINIISLILWLWMLTLPSITFINLFIKNNVYWFWFLQFGNVIEVSQSLWDMDFKYGLLVLVTISIVIWFIYFPFLLAQKLMRKTHVGHQKIAYAKFWIFEILVYIIWVILAWLIFFWKWDGYLISEENWKSEITSSKTKNPELIKYTSSTWSFEVMTPDIMEYSRTINNENATIETIDAYKAALKNEDVVFMIIHDSFKWKLNLEWFSTKEVYNNFIKSYTIKEEKSYKEINWEAYFEILVEYEKQNIYVHGRIIKKNNNEVYNIYSIYSDLSSSELATKFINSFKFTWQK